MRATFRFVHIPVSALGAMRGLGDPAESTVRARALLAEADFGPAKSLTVALATLVFAWASSAR